MMEYLNEKFENLFIIEGFSVNYWVALDNFKP